MSIALARRPGAAGERVVVLAVERNRIAREARRRAAGLRAALGTWERATGGADALEALAAWIDGFGASEPGSDV